MNIYISIPLSPSLIKTDSASVLPEGDPIISGQDEVYSPGQPIDLNCTSERSKPAAQLMWFINGNRVSGIRQTEVRGIGISVIRNFCVVMGKLCVVLATAPALAQRIYAQSIDASGSCKIVL